MKKKIKKFFMQENVKKICDDLFPSEISFLLLFVCLGFASVLGALDEIALSFYFLFDALFFLAGFGINTFIYDK